MRNTAGYSLTICRSAHMLCSAAVTKKAAPYSPTLIYFLAVTQNMFPVLQQGSYRPWTCYWEICSSMPSKIWLCCCNPIQFDRARKNRSVPYSDLYSLSFINTSFSSLLSRKPAKAPLNSVILLHCLQTQMLVWCLQDSPQSGKWGSSLTAVVEKSSWLSPLHKVLPYQTTGYIDLHWHPAWFLTTSSSYTRKTSPARPWFRSCHPYIHFYRQLWDKHSRQFQEPFSDSEKKFPDLYLLSFGWLGCFNF